MAAGLSGTILTSTNGTDWVAVNSHTMNDLKSVTFGQGTFVAVGDGGTILQSSPALVYPLTIWPLVVMPDRTASMWISGPDATTWTLKSSTDLINWIPMAEFPGAGWSIPFGDDWAIYSKQMFYRGIAW